MRFGLTSICREDAVSDFDLYESEIEELYQKPEEPKVELTVEEAKLLFSVIDGFFDLRLPTTKEIVALNKLKVRVEQIEQSEGK